MKLTRDELRAHLDRRPPRDECVVCKQSLHECWDAIIRCCCDCTHPDVAPWEFWFTDEDRYLGTRSARVGPDPVQSAQSCGCDQCAPRDVTTD